MESGCAAIAYETVTDGRGGLPLLAPMSEVAGRLSIEAAAFALRRHNGGRGLLLGVFQASARASGRHWRVASWGPMPREWPLLGAETIIIERSLERLRQLDEMFKGRVRTVFSSTESIETQIVDADVVIGRFLFQEQVHRSSSSATICAR